VESSRPTTPANSGRPVKVSGRPVKISGRPLKIGGRRTKPAKSGRKPSGAGAESGAMARLRSIGPDGPDSRPDGRAGRPSAARRNRITVGVAALVALVVLATSFPFSGLLSQHRQLSAAAAQLHQLQQANRALAEHQQQLNSKAAVEQLARERYQLVPPGSTLYEVLPPGGHRSTAAPGAPTSGDPGTQPVVAPANAPDLSPDPNLSTPQPAGSGGATATAPKGGSSAPAAGGSSRSSAPTSFWSRLSRTLEFWR
jgi:cell division protein FtsB